MPSRKISELTAAGSLAGTELVEVSALSATVTRTATTISAQASDNSFNDSGAGFVTAGFAVGDNVRVTGFTGNTANNITSARITALTASKMTIGGTDGDVIVDDAAGESVTITKWVSRRTTAQAVRDLAGGGGSSMTNPMTTAGDLIVGGTAGAPTRLGVGADGKVLKVVSGVPAWADDATGGGGSTGDVVGPASSIDNTLPRFDGTTGKAIQGSGVVVTDSDEISGYRGNINAQTGTSYTLVAADTGKVVELTNAAAITLNLPNNLPVGWCCTVVQGGAGAITFTPASGANRRNRQSHTKTAGQYAVAMLYVRTNAGGSAAEYVLGGDTAA